MWLLNPPFIYIFFVLLGILFKYFISLIAYFYLLLTFYSKKIKKFNNKHVFIFGASQGLGKAVALLLSEQGIKLSIGARNTELLSKVKNLCLKKNSKTLVEFYQVDITKKEEIIKALENSIEKYGFPSLIINCAGISHPGFFLDLNLDIYYKDMELNYFGNLKVLKTAFKFYKKLGNNCDLDIVCVGSVLGLIGSIGYSSYVPTKYALKGLLDVLRYETLTSKIKLHYYAPSNIDTPGFLIENKTKPKLVKEMEDNAQTISAEKAAEILLKNMDDYIITSEPNLEMLKTCSFFMSKFKVLDYLLMPIANLGVIFSGKNIDENIIRRKFDCFEERKTEESE